MYSTAPRLNKFSFLFQRILSAALSNHNHQQRRRSVCAMIISHQGNKARELRGAAFSGKERDGVSRERERSDSYPINIYTTWFQPN